MIVKIGGCLIMLAIAAVVIWLLFLVSPVLLPIAFWPLWLGLKTMNSV